MAERFYIDFPPSLGELDLTGPEAHHLAAVCRARPGDRVCLFCGDGREYPARVVTVAKKVVTLCVEEPIAPPRELFFPLVIAAPLPKGDRADFLIEKLTELGVTAFVPLRTARSVVHPREAKLDRLQRQVIEASKQCGRNVLMKIEPLTDWADWWRRTDLPTARLLAHPGSDSQAGFDVAGPAVAAVGPEGGFTDDEVSAALAHGWTCVSLGARTLRVETAAIALAVRLSSPVSAAP
jgi:16S rRNA (uracil1498-N3)-methyltransferase